MTAIANQLGVQVVEDHGKYLGLPTFVGKNKRLSFKEIKDRVWAKLQGWKGKLFSKGAKEILIKAVVQALPTYFMSAFKLPFSLIGELNSMMANFWWGSSEKGNKMHWVSWSKLCQNKSAGGLGFRALDDFNRALLAKQVWRILSQPESLLSRVLKGKYFPNCGILSATVGSNPSFTWRSLFWGMGLLSKGIRWRIGDGSKVRIYSDPWIPRPTSFKPCSPISLSCEDFVSSLISPSGDWNSEKVRQHFLPLDADLILSIPLGRSGQQDQVQWHYCQDGNYTVKSGYWLSYREKNVVSSSDPMLGKIWRKLWALKLPRKILIFLWRACENSLPTMENLFRRGVSPHAYCSRCCDDIETISHALWGCQSVVEAWDQHPFVSVWPKIYKLKVFDAVELMLSYDGGSLTRLFCLFLWTLWYARNSVVFHQPTKQVGFLLAEAKGYLAAYDAVHSPSQLIPLAGPSSWCKPFVGCLKLNTDASLKPDGGRVGLGFILRNHEGSVLLAGHDFRASCLDVRSAEAWAILVGLRAVLEKNFLPVVVESDALSVVLSLKSGDKLRSDIGIIFDEIFSLCQGRLVTF